ncbi:unnamed protein product, partial [Laminaria digitata]
AGRASSALPESLPVDTEGLGVGNPFADNDALLQGGGGGASVTSAQGGQPPLGDQPLLDGRPPLSGQSSQGGLPSQEGQPSLGADSEASGMPGPAGLHDRPVDQAAAAATLPASGAAQSGGAGGGEGESDAAQESGDKLGIDSCLSTPFGAWSIGSGTRAGEAEGFPSAEIGGILRGPPSGRPLSAGKTVSAGEPLSSSGLSRAEDDVPPLVASIESALAVGEQAVGAGQLEGGAGVPEASAVEGKEDERPRWDTPATPAAEAVAAVAATAPPAVTQEVTQAEKKLDVGGGDWKEASGSSVYANGQEDAEGLEGGVVVPAEDERAVSVEGKGKGLHVRDIGASLFSSESSE